MILVLDINIFLSINQISIEYAYIIIKNLRQNNFTLHCIYAHFKYGHLKIIMRKFMYTRTHTYKSTKINIYSFIKD